MIFLIFIFSIFISLISFFLAFKFIINELYYQNEYNEYIIETNLDTLEINERIKELDNCNILLYVNDLSYITTNSYITPSYGRIIKNEYECILPKNSGYEIDQFFMIEEKSYLVVGLTDSPYLEFRIGENDSFMIEKIKIINYGNKSAMENKILNLFNDSKIEPFNDFKFEDLFYSFFSIILIFIILLSFITFSLSYMYFNDKRNKAFKVYKYFISKKNKIITSVIIENFIITSILFLIAILFYQIIDKLIIDKIIFYMYDMICYELKAYMYFFIYLSFLLSSIFSIIPSIKIIRGGISFDKIS